MPPDFSCVGICVWILAAKIWQNYIEDGLDQNLMISHFENFEAAADDGTVGQSTEKEARELLAQWISLWQEVFGR